MFGMGTGVALPQLPPAKSILGRWPRQDSIVVLTVNARVTRAHARGVRAIRMLAPCDECVGFIDQAERIISTGKLNVSPRLHLLPIDLVVYQDPSGRSYLGMGFVLRCFQRLSLPHIATRLCHWRDNRITRGASTSVLSY